MNRIIQSAVWSFFVVCILNGILVIVKESYGPLKTSMAELTGHHWVTHGVIIIALQLLLTFALAGRFKHAELNDEFLSKMLTSGVVLGVVLITGFYIIH